MRTNEWQETSIALAKPSAEQLRSPPCRSSLGAKAIECTRMSSWPHCLPIASNTASSSPGTRDVERQEDRRARARCASGSTYGRAFSLR